MAAYDQYLSSIFPVGLTVLAVGGYGRQELFPNSDIDVLLLTDTPPHNEATRDAFSAFLRALWDASCG